MSASSPTTGPAPEHLNAPAAETPDAVTRWLNTLESTHRYVVYESDPTKLHWTGRCLRQADRILAVAMCDSRETSLALLAVLTDVSAESRHEESPVTRAFLGGRWRI